MRRGRRVAATLALLLAVYAGSCLVLGLEFREPRLAERDAPAIAAALPPGFLMGAATSAHQIEGGNRLNDWSAFEAQPGHIARGEVSGRADDHWNRVGDDVELLRRLGANSYRFSVEWSRLEPAPGQWDEAAFEHYRNELGALRAARIAPMLTLLHFTLPAWVAARGGLEWSEFPHAFGRFAAEAAARLGASVELWCTINEPNVQMYNGYVIGSWPPGKHSAEGALRAYASLLRAHAAAARAVRAQLPHAQIGVAVNVIAFEPEYSLSLLDLVAARVADRAFNWVFLDAIRERRVRFQAPGFPSLDEPAPELAGTLDFVGLNYYRRERVHFSPSAPGMVDNHPGPGPKSDLGWEMYAPGLTRLLLQAAHRYRLPLYVTENGVADARGERRVGFLLAHLSAVLAARDRGADVRGYFHWSLLDNFEWADGFAPRFGLYRVDYATLERSATPAVDTFRQIAQGLRQR